MWLKLTRKDNGKQQLYNMDVVQCIIQQNTFTMLQLDIEGHFFEVNESLAEIELYLLKGTSINNKIDPRSRDVIGRIPDNELSESDWNLRYNKL